MTEAMNAANSPLLAKKTEEHRSVQEDDDDVVKQAGAEPRSR